MSLIKITVVPQPMDENFDAVMDAAYREVRIAEAAPRMIRILQRAAHVIAELPANEQSSHIKALQQEIVDTIKQATPEYYGG